MNRRDFLAIAVVAPAVLSGTALAAQKADANVIVFNPSEKDLKKFADEHKDLMDKAKAEGAKVAATQAQSTTSRFGGRILGGAIGKAAGAVTGSALKGDPSDAAPVMLAESIKPHLQGGKVVLEFFGPQDKAKDITALINTAEFKDKFVLVIVDPDNKVFKDSFDGMVKGFGDVDAPQVAAFKGNGEKSAGVTSRKEVTADVLKGYLATPAASVEPETRAFEVA